MKKLLIVLVVISLTMFSIVSGCSNGNGSDPVTSALYSILGTWAYTMIMGTDTWDAGTITFTGTDTSGTYTKMNIYNIEYQGTYTVDGSTVTITETDQTWTGTLSDEENISGTWTHVNSDAGTWTATKQ